MPHNTPSFPLYDHRMILDRITDGIVAFDTEMNYIFVNRRGGELLGRKPEDLIGKNYWKEYPEAKGTPFANAYVKALETQKPIIFEAYYQPWDRWFENRIYPSREGLTIFFTEVTERKKAEEALHMQNKFITALTNTAPAIIYIYDLTTHSNVYSNNGIERILGYTREEIKAAGAELLARFVHPDDLPAVMAFQSKIAAAKDQEVLEIEYRTRHKDGQWLTLHSYESPFLRLSDGSVQQKIGVAIDVTERALAEKKLRDRERQLSTLIGNLPGAVYRCRNDKTYTTEFVSAKIEELTGCPVIDFEEHRRNISEFIHADDQERVWSEIQSALGKKRPFELTYRIRDAQGKEKWVWEQGRGIYDPKGELEALEGFVLDITDRKRQESLVALESQVLSMVAQQEPLAQILERIVLNIEALSHETIASILLLDDDGVHVHHGASPHLPDSYNRAIEGAPIGPVAGSCGTAAYRKEPVIVTDIETDPLWENYRHLILPHGLRACWSTPIINKQGKVLGTFAMYYREPRSPKPEDFKLIEFVTHLTLIVLERKRAEEKLRRSREQLRALTSHLQNAIEEERARIAREIHDDIGQTFTAIKMDLFLLLRTVDGVKEKKIKTAVSEEVTALIGLLDRGVQSIRKIVRDLRPEALETMGLLVGIEWQAKEFEKRTKIRVSISLPKKEPQLEKQQAVALFRIVQEALTNVARHAEATKVKIELEFESGQTCLRISDNGKGISEEDMAKPHSFGLLAMRERVAALGGELTIGGRKGKGTVVEVRLHA
jgi:PAS domain S-box-containing protein